MGSRINIKLSSLIGQPGVRLEIYTEEYEAMEPGDSLTTVPVVRVHFDAVSESAPGFVMSFDLFDGVASTDWNWFRYPNDPEHFSRLLLRMLFERSIDFSVMH